MNRNDPYKEQFWGNTQKHMLQQYKERFEFGGFVIGPDEEFMIIRQPITILEDKYHAEATVASQTGLHIKIDDLRDGIVNLKLSKAYDADDNNDGDFIQFLDYDSSGAAVITGRFDEDGVYQATSLAEYKENMKDLTEHQMKTILEKLPVYRFNYKRSPNRVHVSPEATEFKKITGWGNGESLSPMTIAGIALRLVKWVWQKVETFEARLTAIETKLSLQNMPSEETSEEE